MREYGTLEFPLIYCICIYFEPFTVKTVNDLPVLTLRKGKGKHEPHNIPWKPIIKHRKDRDELIRGEREGKRIPHIIKKPNSPKFQRPVRVPVQEPVRREAFFFGRRSSEPESEPD